MRPCAVLPLHAFPGEGPAHVPLPGVLQDGHGVGDVWGMLLVAACLAGIVAMDGAKKLAVYMRVLRWFL